MNSFEPNWVSPPGETITEVVPEPQKWLSTTLGLPWKEAGEILTGEAEITIGLAAKLATSIGSSPEFWMARECQYRTQLEARDDKAKKLISKLPLQEMIRMGWLEESSDEDAVFQFFGVNSLSEWSAKNMSLLNSVSFRSSKFQGNKASVLAWLRRGLIESKTLKLGVWAPDELQDLIPEIRNLSKKKAPREFYPRLQELGASCGVAIVAVAPPKGCTVFGAVRFSDSKNPVIAVSPRGRTDDQFWFTLFHEIGHLVLHYGEDTSSARGVQQLESEANDFAAAALIRPAEWDRLRRLKLSHKAIIRFSNRVGICPGVVVGQLQFFGIVPHSHYNGLKRSYSWD